MGSYYDSLIVIQPMNSKNVQGSASFSDILNPAHSAIVQVITEERLQLTI